MIIHTTEKTTIDMPVFGEMCGHGIERIILSSDDIKHLYAASPEQLKEWVEKKVVRLRDFP